MRRVCNRLRADSRVGFNCIFAVTGFFTLKEKQVSPEIRARLIRQKNYYRGRGEKTANCTSRQTSLVSYMCGHRLFPMVRKASKSRNTRSPKEANTFVVAAVGKPQIALQGTPLWSPVYAVIGVFTLKEKQASPEIRARPRTPTKLLSRPREKNRKLHFKANLSGHLHMRSQASSH